MGEDDGTLKIEPLKTSCSKASLRSLQVSLQASPTMPKLLTRSLGIRKQSTQKGRCHADGQNQDRPRIAFGTIRTPVSALSEAGTVLEAENVPPGSPRRPCSSGPTTTPPDAHADASDDSPISSVGTS